MAGRTTHDAPVSALDPFSEAFLRDPYPAHQELREAGAVVRLERYGVWAIARHEQVRAALEDWETYRAGAGVGLADFTKEQPWRVPSLLLEADPPEHDGARKATAAALSPKRIRALREAFEREAEALVDRLLDSERFDAIEDLAEAYPVKVFADAVGVPDEGRVTLMAYGDMVFNAFGPRNELFEESAKGLDEVRAWIADMCNAILCFATHPDQWAVLHADPGGSRAAFEEVLRFESPVQTFFRTTTRDVDVDGVRIPAGDKVLLFLAAAGRDPRQWDDPERFDVSRKAGAHLGFGSGTHACVGRMVARLEGEVLLAALARRVKAIELDGEPERKLNNTLRGLAHLPVRIYSPPRHSPPTRGGTRKPRPQTDCGPKTASSGR